MGDGNGGSCRGQGNPPHPAHPKTERYSSAVRRPTAAEVGLYECRRPEETGVVAEAMVIHPTSHTTKTDSVADNIPNETEVGKFGFFLRGERQFVEHDT